MEQYQRQLKTDCICFRHRKGALTKDWNEFNLACDTDTPITPVIDMVRQLFNVYTVWFVTGRCEIARIKHEPGCGST